MCAVLWIRVLRYADPDLEPDPARYVRLALLDPDPDPHMQAEPDPDPAGSFLFCLKERKIYNKLQLSNAI